MARRGGCLSQRHGVGEAGTVAVTPTVMNAILDALAPLSVTDLANARHPRAHRAHDMRAHTPLTLLHKNQATLVRRRRIMQPGTRLGRAADMPWRWTDGSIAEPMS